MINVGIVGIGFMGMIHYLAYERTKGAKVRAIVTRDEKKLAGDWRSIKGNFGPPGTMMDLKGVAGYRALDALLDDPKIDVVDICLPPAMHAQAAVRALKAGKHVFCEKPIAVSMADATRMVRVARSSGKQLLIGHVLPMFPEYNFVVEAARKGRYGRFLGGHFKRIISDPKWIPDFYDPQTVGGPLVDLHIHDAHFIRLLCGMPTGVFSRGRMRGDVVEMVTTQFLFDDPALVVTATSGVINQQGRAFTHAYEVYFERATLLFDFAVLDGQPRLTTPVTVLSADGKVSRPDLGAGDPIDAFASEVKELVKSVRTGDPSTLLAGDLALDALALCHKQTDSVRKGRLVKV